MSVLKLAALRFRHVVGVHATMCPGTLLRWPGCGNSNLNQTAKTTNCFSALSLSSSEVLYFWPRPSASRFQTAFLFTPSVFPPGCSFSPAHLAPLSLSSCALPLLSMVVITCLLDTRTKSRLLKSHSRSSPFCLLPCLFHLHPRKHSFRVVVDECSRGACTLSEIHTREKMRSGGG